MIVVVHGKRTHFRSTAEYLLDKDRERVAWTHTENLATQNPDMAWKVMAATAMDRARIRREAGIRPGGRRSNDVAVHMSLSWHPDEREGLSREEMVRAARGAMRSINAHDRQFLVVCHEDSEQPHVHVLWNRTSPEDGRLLSMRLDHKKLSRWAEQYEKERGKVLCKQREINNAARDRGIVVFGEKKKPRHVYELEKANDNHPQAALIAAQQRALDAKVRRKEIETRAKHKAAVRALDERAATFRRTAREDARKMGVIERGQVQQLFQPRWLALAQSQQSERHAFEDREHHLFGRVSNAVRQIDWTTMFSRHGPQRSAAFRDAFQVLSSSGSRVEAFARRQEKERRRLQREQEEQERHQLRLIRQGREQRLAADRARHARDRNDLLFHQSMEAAALNVAWHERRKQREAAWAQVPEQERGDRGLSNDNLAERSRTLVQDFWDTQHALGLEQDQDVDQGLE